MDLIAIEPNDDLRIGLSSLVQLQHVNDLLTNIS